MEREPAPPRLTRLRRSDLDGEAAALFDAISARRDGAVAEVDGSLAGPFNAYLHTPTVGEHLLGLGGALRQHTALDRGLNELAVCTTCAYWHAEFAFAAHVPMALEHGVSQGVLDALAVNEPPNFDDPVQSLVYELCSSILRTSTVDDDLFERARATFTERELVELVLLCGAYTLTAFSLNTFRVT